VLNAAAAPDDGAREPAAVPPRPLWRRISSALVKGVIAILLVGLVAVGALGLLLDTDFGHRLIVDRIAAIAPDSGLRIRIGRIDGSIWGRTKLRDVRLLDPEGLFAEAPELDLQWQPLAWMWNRLAIDEAKSALVIVHRAPVLDESDGPSLPRFDLHVGRLDIAQLRFEEPVAGTRRVARVTGEAEFRSGRFLLDLDATMRGGGDRLALLVDSAPERDQFDLDLALDAPAGGVLGRMLGTEAPLRIAASGEGGWRQWAGNATLDLNGRRGGELRLTAASGLYRATGWVEPARLLPASLTRLGGARTRLGAEGRIDDGVLSGRFAARSAAIRLAGSGGADLREHRYRDVRLVADLLGPEPLLAGVSAPGARLSALLDGPFDDASLAYRANASRLLVGGASLERVSATGSGRWSRTGLTLPVAAIVGRVGGIGEVNAALLAGLRIDGVLRAAGGRIESDALRFAARGISGRLALQADSGTGRYRLAATATAFAYPLAGLGRADLRLDLRAASGTAISGSARGTVRRVENAALAWASGGPIRIETGIGGGGDRLLFPNMRLSSRSLALSGNGAAADDGALRFEGVGRQAMLGPLALRLQGSAERPLLALRLSRPARSLGLSNVSVEVEPSGSGFAFRARGGSPLGPFSSRGSIRPLRGRSAAIEIGALSLSGANASGVLHVRAGGVSGTLAFNGALAGPVTLAAEGAAQRVEAHLIATDARLGRVPIGSGRIDANLLAGLDGGSIQGRLRFAGTADRLWSLTGLETVRLSGPLALDAEVGGSISEPIVRGDVALTRGRLTAGARRLDTVDARGSFDRSRLVLAGVTGRTAGGGRVRGSGTIAFDGALALRLEGERVEIVERGLDSRWDAALRVGGTVGSPALFGEATLVSGTYRVLGRPVELRSGTMRFDGESPPDPRLDLVARPPVGPAVRITGRASRPVIGVASPF
jgi:translocation and assembly module TamB